MKIAEDLLLNVTNMEFASYASYISESDAVDVNDFPHSELYQRYWLDTSNCVKEYRRKNKSVKRMVNKSNIFDTFAHYCTLDTIELRKLIKEELTENIAWYEETSCICLRMKGLSLKAWKHNQELRSVAGDELTVFVLSVIFCKHTMIYTKTKPWTTYIVQQPMSVEELHAQCSIHLMYLGGGIFGLIHPRPYTIPIYRQINLVITHQLIHVSRTMGYRRNSSEPLDLSITHHRDIPDLPQTEEPSEITEARLARIAHENEAQREAFLHPIIDITGSDPETTTHNKPAESATTTATAASTHHSTSMVEPNVNTDLEYLMETSPADKLFGMLSDVTQLAMRGPLDVMSEAVENNVDGETADVDNNEWTPAFVPRKRLTDCKIKLRCLAAVDIALWCHPTWCNFKQVQNTTVNDNMTSETKEPISDVTASKTTGVDMQNLQVSDHETDIGNINVATNTQSSDSAHVLSDVTEGRKHQTDNNVNKTAPKTTLSSTSGYSSEDLPDVTNKLQCTAPSNTIIGSSEENTHYRAKL